MSQTKTLTTASGAPVADNQNSRSAGPRGPLLLDDFHLIRNAEVLKVLTYFLEHIPVNIHFVILTRSDPALSLSRLRSQHQLVEIRLSDLSFSANDISVLFNKVLQYT